jgi:hypothetical protein
VLAVLALVMALAIPGTLDGPATWLDGQLAGAFEPGAIDRLALPRPGPWLALVIGSLLVIGALPAGSGVRRPLVPGIDLRRARIPIVTRIALTCMGTIVALWWLAPAVAAAARSVDVSPDSLASFWLSWLRRALLVVAGCAALLGVVEWLAGARRLWLALHLTPAQERELRHTRQG